MMMRTTMLALLLLTPGTAAAQFVRVEPQTVSVNAQGPTTAILTFTALEGYTPAEGVWCARLVEAMDRGAQCDPSTIYGQAFTVGVGAGPSGGVFTDVMSVPASVAQRAYETALSGGSARFFYVRRFVAGGAAAGGRGPDQYAVVSCVLGGGGANAPFTLTNVRLLVANDMPVLFVRRGERPPPLSAEIAYTGSGTLRGRWEVVLPGDESPTRNDLLTEGSLPPAERGLRRRYLEIERFNVLLLPTGRVTLPGPDPARLPTSVDGAYTILLRIEVSDDAFGDTRVEGAGGRMVVSNGAAAAFPMPTLRYFVGESQTRSRASSTVRVLLRLPLPDAFLAPDSALTLRWTADSRAGRHRVEIERTSDRESVLSAVIPQGVEFYDVPPFVLARVSDEGVRWRVVALDATGVEVGRSEWRAAQRRPSP